MDITKIAFFSVENDEAVTFKSKLSQIYGNSKPEEADVVVALGGDGFMLETIHKFYGTGKPIYGINHGTVGFLMNELENENELKNRIEKAKIINLYPLEMTAKTADKNIISAFAFNEVSVLRQSRQAANIKIKINEKVRMENLICDGAIVSTAAGSTAYNLSAHGPILPLKSNLLALTPICAFRPRRWHGALLPHTANVELLVSDHKKRPVSAVADFTEVKNIISVSIKENRAIPAPILFDDGHSLEERILAEQFIQ